jgi:cob(I)alamin adenosyltransferase
MGKRLSKIYTRTGDKGETGLGNGDRVAKDCERMEAIGCVDELNSVLGMVLSYELPESVHECLTRIQHECFDLGGELSLPGYTMLQQSSVDRLEQELDSYNEALPALQDFILPAGGKATASCHLARSICRRTERRMITLSRSEKLNPVSLIYLNRLSDLLFVLARILVRLENGQEVLWQASAKPSSTQK